MNDEMGCVWQKENKAHVKTNVANMGLKNYQKRLLPNRGSKVRITKIATRSTGMFVQ